jgi:hypothetical protein
MKKTMMIVGLACAALTSAHANIGYTKAEEIKAHGEPTSTDGNWMIYDFLHWHLSEWINPETNLIEMVTWTKKDGIMTMKDMKDVVDGNLPKKYIVGKSVWKKGDEKWVQGEDGYAVYFSKDGKFFEQIGVGTDGNGYMCVATMRAKEAVMAEAGNKSDRVEKETVQAPELKLGV